MRRQGGFTLVEFLVVVGIIVALAAVIIPNVASYRGSTTEEPTLVTEIYTTLEVADGERTKFLVVGLPSPDLDSVKIKQYMDRLKVYTLDRLKVYTLETRYEFHSGQIEHPLIVFFDPPPAGTDILVVLPLPHP